MCHAIIAIKSLVSQSPEFTYHVKLARLFCLDNYGSDGVCMDLETKYRIWVGNTIQCHTILQIHVGIGHYYVGHVDALSGTGTPHSLASIDPPVTLM